MLHEIRGAMGDSQWGRAEAVGRDLLAAYPGSAEADTAKGLTTQLDQQRAEQARADSARQARLAREAKRIRGTLRKDVDKMRDVTFLYDPSAPRYLNSRSWIQLYLAEHGSGNLTPRLQITYFAEDWLFIDQYLLRVDGRSYTLEPEDYGNEAVERDNSGGSIWEWWDVVAEGDKMQLLRDLSTATSATIRYQGRQYYRDRTITAVERGAIKRMLAAYDASQSQ